MLEFKKPDMEIVRFGKDVIATSRCDCDCDFGFGPQGDDQICTGGTGAGGDVECIQTDAQGNC